LSFSGEAGHFINDGLFLTAVETQGLLLNNVFSDRAFALSDQHAYVQRPTVFRFFTKPFKQRDRHLRWLPFGD
jgi:hypothetical protein